MTEFRWLSERAVRFLHSQVIADFGGLDGVRDPGLLNSALTRPKNLFAYGDPSLAELAASLGHGLASDHPFVDGNKRTALAAVDVFLRLNGFHLLAEEAEAVVVFIDLAAGNLAEGELALWIAANAGPFDPDL